MFDHYGLSEEQSEKLTKQGVTIKHLFNSVKLFDPHGSEAELGGNATVPLMHYIDKKGDFNQPPHKFPHKLIAKAMFENLDIHGKIAIAEYADWAEHDFDPEWEDE